MSANEHMVTDLRCALSDACDLLNAAKCPNAHCVNGIIQEGIPRAEIFPCQFCDERQKIVAEHG